MEPHRPVLQSKPRQEAFVWQQLPSFGLETFYGYLFVRADLDTVGPHGFDRNWVPPGASCSTASNPMIPSRGTR